MQLSQVLILVGLTAASGAAAFYENDEPLYTRDAATYDDVEDSFDGLLARRDEVLDALLEAR